MIQSDFILTRRVEQDSAPASATQRYTCEAVCKLCGHMIYQAINIPKEGVEKGVVIKVPDSFFDEEVVKNEMFKALERNHSSMWVDGNGMRHPPRCPKKVVGVGRA